MIGPFDPYSGLGRQDYMNQLSSLDRRLWDSYMQGVSRRAYKDMKADVDATAAEQRSELLLLIEDETP